MANGHGGKRPGAGRRPKALRYRAAVNIAEREIARNLPSIVRKMIHAATEGGDMGTARYLCDRLLGRTAPNHTPPAHDDSNPRVSLDRLHRIMLNETATEREARLASEWAEREQRDQEQDEALVRDTNRG